MKKSISIGLLFLMIILASCKKDKATNPAAMGGITSNSGGQTGLAGGLHN